MKTDIIDLVSSVGELVTLPDVFIRINQLVENPDSTIGDIAQAVSQDPAFTVRLLRVANSPLYGLTSSIDTVSKAVSIIGTGRIRNLALSTALAESFSGLSNSLVSMENFWRHSLYCGLAAKKLAKLAGRCDSEAVFTAGLLHDIGELVIFSRKPELAKEALLLVLDSADELALYEAERQVMGFDHAQVGGELAHQWHLPPMLAECIACHHDIHVAKNYPRENALVHIANILAQMAEVRTLEITDVAPINPDAWKIAGLVEADVVEAVLQETQSEIVEAEKLFFGKT
jgi:putative nucleotidyltransferase with HDIG domain